MLCYVKCKRLIRKFLKTNQTDSKVDFWLHLTPIKDDKEIEKMLADGIGIDEIFRRCFKSSVTHVQSSS